VHAGAGKISGRGQRGRYTYAEDSNTSYDTRVLGAGDGVVGIGEIALWCGATGLRAPDLDSLLLWCHCDY